MPDHLPDDLQVQANAVVNDTVAETGDLPPRQICMTGSELHRDPPCRLPNNNNLKISHHGVDGFLVLLEPRLSVPAV
jgi:hypothetical protein